MFDHAKAERTGIDGVLLTVTRADQRVEAGVTQVTVDYSGFAEAYGGDWRSRLRLVSLPRCALTTPKNAGCLTATELGSTNDARAQKLSAPVSVSGTEQVLAVTASAASSSGDYAATKLSSASSWVGGSSSGDFSWSYPFRVPPATGGPSPSLELQYSAQSVDGRTAVSNNQPSWVGEGFELSESYVERRYANCSDEGHTGKYDQCWKYDNATLVMNGKSNELVKSGSTWRLKDDDGSKVEKVTGENSDNNNEAWKVTTQDGTQYFFGRNVLPGLTSSTPTNSVWTVPVFADKSGEECYKSDFSTSFCDQGWRWNLDYVVDPHGNAMTMWYAKETNYYAKYGATTATAAYTRGGYLTSIKYGQTAGTLAANAPMQVDFDTQERCVVADCSSLTSTTAYKWPDVPFDQICASGAACKNTAPTFFSRRRLQKITTKVLKGSSSAPVDQWQLTQTFPPSGDLLAGNALWLQSITHTGLASSVTPATPLKVTFGEKPLANRVDSSGDGISPMMKMRVGNIWTETGAVITINYADPECVANTHMPGAADRNTMRCYPLKWTLKNDIERDDWFHRYVVDQVRVSDPTGGGDPVVTNYIYSGGAAWHYQENAFIPKKHRNWSDWRGYKTVTVSEGDSNQPGIPTKVVTTYFRGMDGDRLSAGGTKAEVVADSTGTTRVDAPALAGKPRESITYQAAGSTAEVSGTITDYWTKTTATQTVEPASVTDPDHDPALVIRSDFAKTSSSQSRTARDAGRDPMYRTVTTAYDDATGLPVKSQDGGDAAKLNDETCTLTTYASNSTTGMVAYPSRVVTSTGLCVADSADPPKERALADTRTSYDSGGFGVAPTKGDVRLVERLSGYDSSGHAQYSTVATNVYDTLGRVTSTTDVLGRTTDTAYTPAGPGPLTQTVVQQPPVVASGGTSVRLTTKTDLLPEWGVSSKVTDPNQKVTELTYDTMGRLTGVWLPNRKAGTDGPNTRYTYNLSAGVASSVRTETLNADTTGYLSSYALYDAMLRPRQTQSPAADGGRVIAESKYDSRGLAIIQNGDVWNSTEPSGTLVSILDAEALAETVSTYDGAKRLIQSTFASAAQDKWSTRTVYGGDTVTTLPPAGAPATAEISDARGQVVERREYDSNVVTSGYIPTNYSYDLAGRMTKLVSGGSSWTNTYDLMGRKVQTTDPDAGTTTYGYDDADRLISSTDANQQTLLTTYDNLDRKVTLHEGAKTDGQLLASWLYDGVGNLGQPQGSIRYTIGKTGPQYKNLVISRNVLYNPTATSVVIPSAEGTDLARSYRTDIHYAPDQQTPNLTYLPGGGTVAAEELDYTYNRLGQPLSMRGDSPYLRDIDYSKLGDPLTYFLGSETSDPQIQQSYENGTHRLTASAVALTASYLASHRYDYDPAGNVLKDTNDVGPDTQCYDYDGHRRLTDAWTPASKDCAAAPTASSLGGAAPYWQSWTYSSTGLRKTETNHTATGDTTSAYTYDTTRTHSLSKVATTGAAPKPDATYTYNPTGGVATRPGDTGQQTLSWNSEGKLSKLSAQSGDTNYIYDADGNLLLRKSADQTTLFVGSLEVTVATSSGAKVVSAQRHYSVGGKDIAVRSGANKLNWLFTDNHNTSQVTADKTTQAATTRYSTPFGAPRGATATWSDTHGFLGKPEDKNTGLTHVGAREYDPTTGRFLSVDPILNTADPQSLLAYTYANNNPVTLSDPDGTCPLLEGESRCNPGKKTPAPPPAPHNNHQPTPSQSNSSESSSNSSKYDDDNELYTPPGRPHPDRMFEIAGCYGGPGCVMPEGYAGMYGPYRYKPMEKEFGDLLLTGLAFDLPLELGMLPELAASLRSAAIAARVARVGTAAERERAALSTLAETLRAGGGIGKDRNLAVAQFSIDGESGQMAAVSGVAPRAGFVGMPKNPMFWRGSGDLRRASDTEWKILEKVASMSQSTSRGTVSMYSERTVCPSCSDVINQFKWRFPNINIQVYSGGR
ncbi:RHS repeat-associated core domain-containing protein [Kribbella monticola]|uniref:RHS repeat-associated core domain-containing protein n=1 Tax=Kribbella monticola TaxID=2185285 RepID=UPI0018E58C41|nr:RHS repeat-associated core domain-containing protein [Kribbella monticola]